MNLDPLEYDYEYGRNDELEWREGGALSLTDSSEDGTYRQDEIVDDDQDTTSPAVSVELTGSGDDGTYSQDEIGDDGTVTAQVTLEEGTEVGDTLTVTDKDGNVLDERTVTQDDLDNGVSVEVPVAEGDTDVSVTATVTDPAGNTSSDDDQKPVDNVPPQVTVELTGSGDDGTYSQDEIGDDGTVTAQVTLEEGTEVGDTLTVTD
ncbi:hypothetical protein ACGTN6_19980, partial [Halomonas sp. THAF12]|uniref:hypothetical protein n=1 Tax=Halomonas sp. B23F22_10 TaxID=3459515 RepID=UPI00373E0421